MASLSFFAAALESAGGAGGVVGVGDAGDEPFAIDADEIEEVGAAVVDLAVDEEVEGRPDDGEVAVDVDDGRVDAFFDAGGGGAGDALGEGGEVHLRGLAVAHEDERASGQKRQLDGDGVAAGHAVEEGMDGGEDGLVVGGGGVGGQCDDSGREKKSNERAGDEAHRSDFSLAGAVITHYDCKRCRKLDLLQLCKFICDEQS